MTLKQIVGWSIIITIVGIVICFMMMFLGVHQAFLVLLILCGSWLVATLFCIAVELIRGEI